MKDHLKKLSRMSYAELAEIADEMAPIPYEDGVTPQSLLDSQIDVSVRDQIRAEKAASQRRRPRNSRGGARRWNMPGSPDAHGKGEN